MPVKEINHRTYNNKSRKGEYIEIITDYDGKIKRKIYKWDPRRPYDYYTGLARTGMKSGKQYEQEWIKAMQGQKSKVSGQWSDFKKKQVQTEFKRIKNKRTVGKLRTWEQAKAQKDKVYEEMFAPLVLDKDLLKLVIKNKEKVKYKMKAEIWIKTRGEDKKEQYDAVTLTTVGKTLEEMEQEIGKYLDRNSNFTLEKLKNDENKGRLKVIDFKPTTNNPSKEQKTTTQTHIRMKFGA